MERTREVGSAVVVALGGLATAMLFVGLYAALTMPVVQLVHRLA